MRADVRQIRFPVTAYVRRALLGTRSQAGGGGDWGQMIHCISILEPLDAHIHSYLGDWASGQLFVSSLSLAKIGP